MRAEHPAWTRSRTTSQSWCNTIVGLGGVVLSMAWVNRSLVAQFYFESPDADLNQARFDWLHDRRNAFEAALGTTAVWDAMAGRKGARIMVMSPFDDIEDVDRWPAMTTWLIEQQIRLREALAKVGGAPLCGMSSRTESVKRRDGEPIQGNAFRRPRDCFRS
ncbi:DUF4268 domain-containing protein [Rhodococcus sp. DMF-1]|nr:DUF4268 domain-containing protein [Rhodococcus ruber]UIR39416.1 DUF4268 domain-containing protein [Rhodococcus sp. DMF-1]WML65983.1 DUF4268 domain-containing protein [Rhodococcus sp. AH-ZY2]